MRVFYLLLKVTVFLLLLGFAARNTDNVVVHVFPGLDWQAPLVFVLLVFFCIGIGIGLVASLVIIGRQRGEILGLKRELRGRTRGIAAPAPELS